MIKHQLLIHNKSGDEYAVKLSNGRIIAACGPILTEDYEVIKIYGLDCCEYDRLDGQWIAAHIDQFRQVIERENVS